MIIERSIRSKIFFILLFFKEHGEEMIVILEQQRYLLISHGIKADTATLSVFRSYADIKNFGILCSVIIKVDLQFMSGIIADRKTAMRRQITG